MPSHARLNFKRAILVGLITFGGLVGASPQSSLDAGPPHTQAADVRFANSPNRNSEGRDNLLWSTPLTALSATRERPIFSPTRRPPPTIARPTPIQLPSEGQPVLTLVGAIAGEDGGLAIFVDSATKAIVRLKPGESHSGWILQEVKVREAILKKEQKIAVLVLPGPVAK